MKFLTRIPLLLLCVSFYVALPVELQRVATAQKKPEPCKLPNLGGTQPGQVCVLKKFLNEFDQLTDRRPQDNVLLFYGNPGTGKTTVSYELAKESGNEPLFFIAAGLTDVGITIEDSKTKQQETKVGAAAISALYAKAKQIVEQTKRPVVIVLDDIHDIAPKKPHNGISPTMQAALSVLNNQLSPLEKDLNPLIITIVTANIQNKDLNQALISRCTLVEVPVPTEENRLEIINYYANKERHHVTEKIRSDLAKKHYEFTGRDIEKVFKNARGVANYEGLEYVEDRHLIKACEERQREIDGMKPTLWERIVKLFRLGDSNQQ